MNPATETAETHDGPPFLELPNASQRILYSGNPASSSTERRHLTSVCRLPLRISSSHEASKQRRSGALGGPAVIVPYRPDVERLRLFFRLTSSIAPGRMTWATRRPRRWLFGAWANAVLRDPARTLATSSAPRSVPSLALAGRQVESRNDTQVLFASEAATDSGKPTTKSPIMPKDYEAVHELLFVTRIGRALLSLPAQPSAISTRTGRCFRPRKVLDALLTRQAATGLLPARSLVKCPASQARRLRTVACHGYCWDVTTRRFRP